MESINGKGHALRTLFVAGSLLLAGTSVAMAASGGEQSHKGMSPNQGTGDSIDSSHAPSAEGASESNAMSHHHDKSGQSVEYETESDHGMAPSARGANTSIDSGRIPSDAGESGGSSMPGQGTSGGHEQDGNQSNHGMEPNEDSIDTSVDSSMSNEDSRK